MWLTTIGPGENQSVFWPMRRKAYYGVLPICCALALVGCVSFEKYPPSWEPLVQQDPADCPTIGGAYLDEGASSVKEPVPSLSFIIGGNRREHLYSHTSIEQSDKDTLVVHFWTKGSVAESKTLHRSSGDFNCTGGRLVFARGEPFIGGHGMVLWIGGSSLHFEVTPMPHALIVDRKEFGAGVVAPLLIPIPIAGGGNNWFRYERSQPLLGLPAEKFQGLGQECASDVPCMGALKCVDQVCVQ